jgi:hypothetical protein
VVLALVLSTAACGDDDFGVIDWAAVPDTSLLYSASRPDLLQMPAGFDFVNLQRVVIESERSVGTWDIVLLEQDGVFQLAAESFVTGSDSRAGIATTSATTLEEVREAPSDTASFKRTPVPIQPGAVYVVRTRRSQCFTLDSGVRYGKLRALVVDAVAGTFEFEVVRNPNCNNRSLVTPDD